MSVKHSRIVERLGFEFYFFFLAGFFSIFCLSVGISVLLQKWFLKIGVVDQASAEPSKKKHSGAVALTVGSGSILLALGTMLLPVIAEKLGIANFYNYTQLSTEWANQIIFFVAAVLILLAGGYIDDKYRVKPITQLIFVGLAVALVIVSGVRIRVEFIQNDIPYLSPAFLSIVVTGLWLYICSAATKFLDGHDGLVTTVGITGLLGIAAIALLDRIQNPLYAYFALTWVFALAGFLPLNFPRARAYLGEGASIAIGFCIGYLSIVINSKIAVSNAILGLFLLDLFLVWILRYRQGRNFFTSGDRLHWHHRLLDTGLDKLQVLAFTTVIVLINIHIAIWQALANNNNFSLYQFFGFVVTLLAVSMFLRRKKTSQA